MTRKIVAKGPRYLTYLDRTKSLSQRIAEQEADEAIGLKKRKGRAKKAKFVPCQECPAFKVDQIKEGIESILKRTIGHCTDPEKGYPRRCLV